MAEKVRKPRGTKKQQSASKTKSTGSAAAADPPVKTKPKSKRARRILAAREPKLVEDPKKALLLYGGRTSQVVKDVLTDFGKLKGLDAVKLTRKNADVRPFEAGGESQLEHLARRADAALFALGTSTKKRPHNLVLGRIYDGHLFDMMELGVEKYSGIKDFGAAAEVQVGNKPAIVFAGEDFEKDPVLGQVKGLLLDFFRGRQISTLALGGLDRVMCVSVGDASTVVVRQYRVKLKKTGTKLPRVELLEMGPRLDLTMRRRQEAPGDLSKEAHKQPRLEAKKQKNVSRDELDGKVGRIYMPQQTVDEMPLRKMKGLKRERQQAAAEAKAAKKSKSKGPAAEAAPIVDMTDL